MSRKRIAGDNAPDIELSEPMAGRARRVRHWWLVLRCGVLGTGLGAIPGIGSAVIDWIAYGYAQRTEKNPETFGTGDVRGVIAPESSNNAKEGGHLVPTIAFGVPAGASMAILLGAFLMHGLTPGPEMLTKHLDVTYTIVWSLTLAHVIGAMICLCCSRWLAQISRIRPEILLPIIVALVFVAAFEGSHDWGDLFSLFVLRRHRLDHEAAGLAAPAAGARPRHRRHFRALSVHLHRALRLGMAAASGRCSPSSPASLGRCTGRFADRREPDPRIQGRRAPIACASAPAASSRWRSWLHRGSDHLGVGLAADAKLVPLTAAGMALVAARSISSTSCSAGSRRRRPRACRSAA